MCKQAETFWEDRVAGRDGTTVQTRKHVAPGRETGSIEQKVACPVFVRTVQPITKVRAFWRRYEKARGEALGFPPWVAV
jgi:hypothetical protein